MKQIMLTTALLVGLSATAAAGEIYKVTVTGVDRNLYRVDNTNPKLYIETKYCYEYATGEEAILRFEKYSYDNKLIFDSGTSCDVKALR